jgi:hypothetical protein
MLNISDLEPPPAIVDLSKMNPTENEIPESMPPEVAEVTSDNTWPALGPSVPPILGTTIPNAPVPQVGPVPEPSSLELAGSGLICLLLSAVVFRAERKRA